MDIYIYYKVDTRHAALLEQRLVALQATLSSDWQVGIALKRREESDAQAHSLQTWMEIYSDVPEGFLTALEKAIEASDIKSLIAGERHHEFFRDVTVCA